MKLLTPKEFYRQRFIELSPEGVMKRLAKVVTIDMQSQICEDYHQYMVTSLNLIPAHTVDVEGEKIPTIIAEGADDKMMSLLIESQNKILNAILSVRDEIIPHLGELGTNRYQSNPPMDIYNNLPDEAGIPSREEIYEIKDRLRKLKYKTGDPKQRYTNIPIIITEEKGEGWRVEIADNWAEFEPVNHDEVNFEDLGFHFRFRGEIDGGNAEHDYLFGSRDSASAAAVFVNKTCLDNKAIIINHHED